LTIVYYSNSFTNLIDNGEFIQTLLPQFSLGVNGRVCDIHIKYNTIQPVGHLNIRLKSRLYPGKKNLYPIDPSGKTGMSSGHAIGLSSNGRSGGDSVVDSSKMILKIGEGSKDNIVKSTPQNQNKIAMDTKLLRHKSALSLEKMKSSPFCMNLIMSGKAFFV
jgi:hypothetical protein